MNRQQARQTVCHLAYDLMAAAKSLNREGGLASVLSALDDDWQAKWANRVAKGLRQFRAAVAGLDDEPPPPEPVVGAADLKRWTLMIETGSAQEAVREMLHAAKAV
jgi:hypothetical protein